MRYNNVTNVKRYIVYFRLLGNSLNILKVYYFTIVESCSEKNFINEFYTEWNFIEIIELLLMYYYLCVWKHGVIILNEEFIDYLAKCQIILSQVKLKVNNWNNTYVTIKLARYWNCALHGNCCAFQFSIIIYIDRSNSICCIQSCYRFRI